MSSELLSTPFLVLRKIPYSETSLVVAGLSPDHGQLRFFARGARRLGRREYPLVDLFRVLQVEFRSSAAELHSWVNAELSADYASLVSRRHAFRVASWLAGFALENTHSGVPAARLYQALVTALQRLAAAPAPGPVRTEQAGMAAAAVVGTCLAFLDEHGWLPDYHADARRREQRRMLLDMATGRAEPPRLTPQKWHELLDWTLDLLRFAECHVPGPLPEPMADLDQPQV